MIFLLKSSEHDVLTHHIPNMKSYTQGKVDKCDTDDDLELVNENIDETRLKYIGVEE